MDKQNLIAFSLIFLWMALKVYEAVSQEDIVDIILVLFVLFALVSLAFSFQLRQLVKAHMPYLILILAWSLIYQVINLTTSPSTLRSIDLLVISFTLYVYVWHKTKEKRRKFAEELKRMKQKGNNSSAA